MSTSAYDGFYNLLSPEEKQLLLDNIRRIGDKFYNEYVNHLENRIADNHVWQMTFRILTMAAFATVGEIPEASVWTDYCYNEWISRLPGLHKDGGWHNGDAYFHVNIRTLIEVPVFFSRISGFNFFADPWYNNNALYVIYQQPPFSKSGGHGNSHEGQRSPNGGRVGYADALARECNNPWAAAYVHEIMQEDPDILSKAFEAKPADLTVHILPVCRTCIGCRNQISAKIILLRNLIRFLLSVIKVHRCSNGAPLCARIHLAVQIGNQCMPQPHSFPAERKDIIPIIPRSSVLELIITAMQTEYRAEHPILYPSQKQFSVCIAEIGRAHV